MTYSIAARCPRTGQLGVAATTGLPGVGKLVTWARSGVGAAATQAWINPYLGIDGLRYIAEGRSAQEAVDLAIQRDPDRDNRQLGMVDAQGRAAVWTGRFCREGEGGACEGLAEHRTGEGYTVQGNLLRDAETVHACADAFEETEPLALVERLLHALEAGQAAGGDRRGSRSATLYIVETEDYPLWDLRVDEAEEPLAELRRLYRVFDAEVVPQIRKLPSRAHVRGELDHSSLEGFA